jgi:hypothetical protein
LLRLFQRRLQKGFQGGTPMPMHVHAYEHPIKSGARRLVRQLFASWLIVALAFFIFFYATDSHPRTIELALYSLLIGIPVGLVAWFLYRLSRFAIGR